MSDNTNAERQARHRAKQRQYVEQLEAEVKRLRAGPKTPLRNRGKEPLKQELAEAKARIAVLEALPGGGPADLTLDQYADAMVARLRGRTLCEYNAWVVTFNNRLRVLAHDELGAAVAPKPKRAKARRR